ncbi:MAG: glutamate--cysteine ligase [Bacteroidetes bacterium]|nr:glutamate--cysteine ligase [Bacteroidota bacterium]
MTPLRYHLFQAYGVELEYMIVDRDTLDVRPIADELLRQEAGSYTGDFQNGMITWSNELVLHVIELKSSRPETNISALENAFADNVRHINQVLAGFNAMLMPTAAHPWMNPLEETKLWPHDNNEVYHIYNRIFDCRGHGWSNLQSTHLNLPFYDDEEFSKLHAAIRVLLPLLPALCASSPILNGQPTGSLDTRLKYYKTNQAKIPSITGRVIPEAVFSKRQYFNTVYDKIRSDLAIYNENEILDPVWVNSRGAIPRFDRGSIEIRIMDIQESPGADLAVQTLVIETIQALVNEQFVSMEDLVKVRTDSLANILDEVMIGGPHAVIQHPELLNIFDFKSPCTAGELWKTILDRLIRKGYQSLEKWKPELSIILTEGTLSNRILRSIPSSPSREDLAKTYRRLSECLEQNKMFLP